MVHEFKITSPTLGNYTFTLFRVRHLFTIFPLAIYFTLSEESFEKITNESEFEEALAGIMNHKKTINAINGLLAQA